MGGNFKITCQICGVKTGRVGTTKRIFMAKFPLDEERCKQWVKATGNEDLAYVPIEKLHQLKHICEKHFRSKDFSKKKTRLRKNAIPSIEISSTPLPDELLVEFPLHIATSSDDQVIVANTKANTSTVLKQNEYNLQKDDHASNARDPSPELSNVEETPIHSPEFLNESECSSDTEILDVPHITSVDNDGPNNIREDVASSFEYIATTGLNEETRQEFIKKHSVPNNCTAINAPSLTPEIKATLTEQVLKQDEAIEARQKQLAAAISSIGRVISNQFTNQSDLFNELMATGQILCDLQYSESLARYNNINSSNERE